MIPIDKIMVGYDFSKNAKNALEYAVSLAEKCQAELIVVNIINQKTVDSLREVVDKTFNRNIEKNIIKLADDFVDREVNNRLEKIEKLQGEIPTSHLLVKKIVRVGVPFQSLSRIAEAEKADLLIVGSKGRGNLKGILFGSNAEKLFRHCSVPLLSVRPQKREDDR